MKKGYKRAEPKNFDPNAVWKAIEGEGPLYVEIHELADMLRVNLHDKYFKMVFSENPQYGLGTLIGHDCIPLYDFSYVGPGGWIKECDKKPEDGQIVLVTRLTEHTDARKVQIELGAFSEEDGWEWLAESGSDYWEPTDSVTAWQPLPQPFTQEGRRYTLGRK